METITRAYANITNVELDGSKRGIRSYSAPMATIDRLVQTLIRLPGITEITLMSVFTPSDFGLEGAQSWSYRIAEVIDRAEREGVIRKMPCLDPDYHSYFAVKTLVTVNDGV